MTASQQQVSRPLTVSDLAAPPIAPPIAPPAAPAVAAPAVAPAWVPVCGYDDLLPERGVAAWVAGRQVAVFRLADGTLRALSNYDPMGRAYVLSRGIVGSRGPVPTVASPLFKQAYDLDTGHCLDAAGVQVATYPVRLAAGRVEVGVP
jgi:NAD(P)H-dependent nitrite reductase small subunit